MFVKICGTTNLPDAELAVALGANALGFIFAPSKRRVTVEEAAAITRCLPDHVGRVGVFTQPDAVAIGHAAREAGLSAVQMHWEYDPAIVEAVRSVVGEGVELWQVVGVEVEPEDERAADRRLVAALRGALSDPRLAVRLLDSVRGGTSGGQGVAFPWKRVETVLQTAYRGTECEHEPKVVIAGGLNAGNVTDAVRKLRPWGVDVVSGVEARPGVKSPDRMKAFLDAAREAEESFPPLR